MSFVRIYTDGSCHERKQNGGWCAILLWRDEEKVISGGMKRATPQRAELLAVINGLRALTRACKVELYTDSDYVVRGMTTRKEVRQQKMKRQGADFPNNAEWLIVDALASHHDITWIHVQGHSGDKYNERCHNLARRKMKGVR